MSTVKAEVYYSEYGDFSEYQEEVVASDDVTDVETITMYRWYKLNKVIGEYELYTDNFTDDCYETAYSEWSTTPYDNPLVINDLKKQYTYQMIQPVRYIHLYNVHGSYGALRIPELEIYIDGKKTDYTYSCTGCLREFDKYIKNGIYTENNSFIENNGHLIIDLGNEYPINKIQMVMYIYDMGNDTKSYSVGYASDDMILTNNYAYNFSVVKFEDAKRYEHNVEINNSLLNEYVSEKLINNEYVYSYIETTLYRYKEKYCRSYDYVREYYPKYSAYGIDDYSNNDSEKTFYRYRKRNKLELNIHDITIANYDLNNFVIYATDEYMIDSNIDYNKNGVYDINFKSGDIDVKTKVNVMLIDNVIEENNSRYSELKQSLDSLNKHYDDTIIDIYSKLAAMGNVLSQYHEEVNDLISSNMDDFIDRYNQLITQLFDLNKNINDRLDGLRVDVENIKVKISGIDTLQATFDEIRKKYDEELIAIHNYNADNTNKLIAIDMQMQSILKQLNDKQLLDDTRYKEILEKLDKCNERIDQLFYNVAIILDNEDSLSNEINIIKQQMQELLTNLDSTNVDIVDLDKNITKHIESISIQYETKIRTLSDEINTLQGIISRAREDEMEYLNERLKNYESQYLYIHEDYNELQTAYQDYILAMNEKFKNIFDDVDKHIQDTKKDIDDKYAILFQNHRMLEDRISVYESTIKTLNNQILSLEASYKSTIQDYEEKINHLNTRIDDISNNKQFNYLLNIGSINAVYLYALILIIVILIIVLILKKKKKNSTFVEPI